jgi:hypothetical protein
MGRKITSVDVVHEMQSGDYVLIDNGKDVSKISKADLATTEGLKPDPNKISIGTVETGTTASATMTGDSPNQTLNLVLPKGDKGDKGDTVSAAWGTITGDITAQNDLNTALKKLGEDLYTVNIATTDVVANTNTWNTGSHAGWYPYCYTGSKGKNAAGTEVDMGVTAKDELCIQGITETDTQALLDCENNDSYSTYDGSYKIYFRSVPTADINLYISIKKKVTV